MCNSRGAKCLNFQELRKILKLSLHLLPDESDRIFHQVTGQGTVGTVSLGKFDPSFIMDIVIGRANDFR